MTDRPISRIGLALYGDTWKGPMSRDLGIRKDTIDDWARGRGEPHRDVYERLLQLAERRAAGVSHAVTELRELLG